MLESSRLFRGYLGLKQRALVVCVRVGEVENAQLDISEITQLPSGLLLVAYNIRVPLQSTQEANEHPS